MFGYATDLRSRTQGRGSFTMHFGGTRKCPARLAEEIVSKVQGKTNADKEIDFSYGKGKI